MSLIFNGVDLSSLGPYHIEKEPGFVGPEPDYEEIQVPGRSGDLIIFNGSYKNFSRKYVVNFGEVGGNFADMVHPLVNYLTSVQGYAQLTDEYSEGYYWMAYYKGGLEIENILEQAGQVTIEFICKPRRYRVGETINEIPPFDIRLFSADTSDFSGNGLGLLSDVISCTVTEERNGQYELEMEYPIDGILFNQINHRQLIFVKPNPFSEKQAFRVYDLRKPINGIVTVKAAHISYDLSGFPVKVFPQAASSPTEAFNYIQNYSVRPSGFTFTASGTYNSGLVEVKSPTSIRAILGGGDNSIAGIFGGEFEFDMKNVIWKTHRGLDRGLVVRYGINLTDMDQEENISEMYTGVYPFWYSEQEGGGLVTLTDGSGHANGVYPILPNATYDRILSLDLSSVEFSKTEDGQALAPTEAQLIAETQKYISANHLDRPTISLTVSFVPLYKTTEGEGTADLEKVCLCDTVTVVFDKLGVRSTAQVVKTEYDALTDRYKSVSLGDPKSNLTDTISNQGEQIKQIPTKTTIELAVEQASKLITGAKGGHVLINQDENGHPYEILIMDTDDIATAEKVWRWNQNGLGYSSTGYNGTYSLAMTRDGEFVADFIRTGNLDCALLNVSNIHGNSILVDTIDALTGINSNDDQGYTLTTSKPSNWATTYKNYFTLNDGLYEPVTGDTAPTWEANKYYSHVTNKTYQYVKTGQVADNKYGIAIGYMKSSTTGDVDLSTSEYILVTADRLSFMQGTTEVAYMAGNALVIQNGDITASDFRFTNGGSIKSQLEQLANSVTQSGFNFDIQGGGHLTITSAQTAESAVELGSDGALRLMANSGDIYMSNGAANIQLHSDGKVTINGSEYPPKNAAAVFG